MRKFTTTSVPYDGPYDAFIHYMSVLKGFEPLRASRLCNKRDRAMSRKSVFFEISWEVCNMVGGIHTVLASRVSPR